MTTLQDTLPAELPNLVQFFSPSSNCPSQPLPFRRLALFGAVAPSTPLHFALSYATPAGGGAAHPDEASTEARNVLLLCTSRNKFLEGLVLENEEYLALHGGDPAVARVLEQNVEMKFLDTMARWTFFCSSVATGEYQYVAANEAKALNLKKAPDLVIVSGLSLFLQEDRNTGYFSLC